MSITYIYYNLDTKGFIEAFCENKDKPALECNGKCQLKKITKTTDNENNRPIQLIDFKDLLVYNQQTSSFPISDTTHQNKHSFYYLNLYNFKLLETCFHPPNA
ncbi:hypothetical protein [Polaribacter sp. IC073]|uniref:hypothetical protein n=1 Tax=Polaribacter sp. IC073 TaxID=2508540 RepID=UPI0011BF974B|nr:hypothetical protein [Polaribacter sp. IC073]TXD49721.1 hypothetical protein ES045_00615 [Polaribacter sp. IC073]